MAKFEGVQQEILNSNAGTQLVSAGAGSGKTTVMIEKLKNLILTNGVDVDNLLVVTFTVLAAEEMKDRLVESLIKESEISDEPEKILQIVEKLKTASIDTFDGFISKTIKKYFYILEISPNVEILSDTRQEYFLVKAMKKTLDEADEGDLLLLLDLYGSKSRNYETLKTIIFDTYTKISNEIEPFEFLDQCVAEYKDSSKSEKVINKYILSFVHAYLESIKDLDDIDSKILASLMESIEPLKCINEYMILKSNLEYLYSFKSVSITTKQIEKFPCLDAVKTNQDKLNNCIKKLKENGILPDFDEKNSEILNYFEIFIKLLKGFIYNYSSLKEKNNLVDFVDATRLMLKLFDNEMVLKELQNKYKYIFIDEYQDVNPLQDCLMGKLTTKDTKLFMVGDVKQSIYGFRGSSPEMFLDRYTHLKTKLAPGEAFDMNLNFRSNPKLLSFINDVFSKLMTTSTSDIDFSRDCLIDAKRDDIPEEKVSIAIFSKDDLDKDLSKTYSVKNDEGAKILDDKEQEYVLNTIISLIGTKFYDPSLKDYRNLEYKDFAILSQSEKSDRVISLIEKLRAKNIPVNSNTKFDIKSSESLNLIKSILKCVQNTADDVDYFATFNALTELTIDDFVQIRNKEYSFADNLRVSVNEKVKQGFDKLDEIRRASFSRSNVGLIRYILDEIKLRYFILKMPNGVQEMNQLNLYLDSIGKYDDNLNLGEFLDFLESGIKLEATFNISDNQNSVTVQTIHKSKGLEYPVVILFDCFKEFPHSTDAINYNSNIGLGLDYFNISNRYKTNSTVKFAISVLNEAKVRKEKLRLLYVAMTRAKNKLIITGTSTKTKPNEYNSFMNMILSCYPNFDRENDLILNNCEILVNPNMKSADESSGVSEIVTKIKDNFQYQNTSKFDVVLKNSVTGINSQIAQEKGYVLTDVFNVSTQYDSDEIKSIGTHYHKALELCDFSKEYTQNTDFEDVDYSLIKKAHQVFSKLINGAIVKKEAEFMMYIPYNEIVDSNISDKVLIQGVVDLMIIRDDCIDIVDYKFSSLSVKSLKAKYKEQLELYRLAVEKAYNKPVRNAYIYSIKTGELG